MYVYILSVMLNGDEQMDDTVWSTIELAKKKASSMFSDVEFKDISYGSYGFARGYSFDIVRHEIGVE